MIAVGRAAKESLASWVEAHGGTADPDNLHLADASVISPGLRMVGVLHPGGAGKGGAVSAIVASFKAAIEHVHQWTSADPSWLPVDPGATRSTAAYTYSSDPIPFADFPYGVAWRLGRGSTSSNRRDGQTAIQIFSDKGAYNTTTLPTRAAQPAPPTATPPTPATLPGNHRDRHTRISTAAPAPPSPHCCKAVDRAWRGPTSPRSG